MNVEKMAVSPHFVDKYVDKLLLFLWNFFIMPVDFVDNFFRWC